MQLFPTAFWRPGLTEEPVEGDSCYLLTNVSVLNEDDNSYRLDVATTPDAEGLAGVGLYKDYSFNSLHDVKYGKNNDIKAGLPFAHVNRADGRKTRYTNSDGTIVDNVYDKDYNPEGVIHTTKNYVSDPWGFRAASSTFTGWEEFWELILGATSNPGNTARDLPEDVSLAENFVLNHWLYIWMEQPSFSYGGANRSLHKTSPVTITLGADCKTATITCYFEKDATQKLFELSEGPATAEKIATDDNDFTYEYAWAKEINQLVKWGFNGYQEYIAANQALLSFPYRQKAKARLKFTLGSVKDLTIKIKGLGTDYHDQFSEGTQGSVIDREYFFFDEGPRDKMKRGLYAITPELIRQDKRNLNINPNHEGIYALPGDVQSCTIFFDDEEKIKCVAPVLNYFPEYFGSIEVEEHNRLHYTEQFKGPVRIFEYKGTSLHVDDNAIIKNYEGVGDSNHPVEGLGYIEEDQYPAGFGYMTNEHGQEVTKWADYKSWVGTVNPYGSLWTKDRSYFYDGGSNMITPDYSSPYQYTHTLNNVSAGEHTIDVVFDSVAEMFNGGAYYEIEISHT